MILLSVDIFLYWHLTSYQSFIIFVWNFQCFIFVNDALYIYLQLTVNYKFSKINFTFYKYIHFVVLFSIYLVDIFERSNAFKQMVPNLQFVLTTVDLAIKLNMSLASSFKPLHLDRTLVESDQKQV